jgi:hypothetical protein
MADQLFTTSDLDSDGRQLVLDDQISHVYYYDASAETWDKTGGGSSSWYLEKYLPNDYFSSAQILADRWQVLDTPEVSESTLTQSAGFLNAGVEDDEGIVGLSSSGKWSLMGDFEIRLYIDWSSYYNEYRSVTHSFLKVGKDSENAARISFCFDGSAYKFSSEKTVNRPLDLFDWKENGDAVDVTFSAAQNYLALKIVRTDGVIKTYISTATTDTQVGEDIDDAVFSEDLYVELGVEAKEYNTYRHGFTKFVVTGETNPTIEFFSANRGVLQSFPERSMLVVDGSALSIIDFDTKSLWMRFLLGSGNSIPVTETKPRACNGTIYVPTTTGLLAFDFTSDRIYKYLSSSIQVSIDPIALRNAPQIYKTHMSSTGTLLSASISNVACKKIGSQVYVAMTTDAGISVKRPLTAGVYNSTNGALPATLAEFTDTGSLYWSGFDPSSNTGSLSYRTSITSLVVGTGTNTFSRTGFYSTSTALSFFGENIQTFDVKTVSDRDVIAVGTSEGLSYIGFTYDQPVVNSVSYGVESVPNNPISDPSFENYLGLDWKVYYNGLHKKFAATRETSFVGAGSRSLRLRFKERTTNTFFTAGTYGGVYQDVDLTGVHTLYYDIKMVGSEADNAWNFQILVDDTVVKEYLDTDGPFTKLTDSVTLGSYTGVHRLWFRIYTPNKHTAFNLDSREVYIDNIRTSIGNPSYRILPAGNASIKEVLLQWDEAGRKIYFASPGGYGAVDIDDNSLDYFTELEVRVPDTDILSGDFSRAEG